MRKLTIQVSDKLYDMIKTNAEDVGVSEEEAAVLCIENFFGMCRAIKDDCKQKK